MTEKQGMFDPERWPGDNLPCPRCGSTNTIRLVSISHCNKCQQPFTPYEVELKARIVALEAEVERLRGLVGEQKRRTKKCAVA